MYFWYLWYFGVLCWCHWNNVLLHACLDAAMWYSSIMSQIRRKYTISVLKSKEVYHFCLEIEGSIPYLSWNRRKYTIFVLKSKEVYHICLEIEGSIQHWDRNYVFSVFCHNEYVFVFKINNSGRNQKLGMSTIIRQCQKLI